MFVLELTLTNERSTFLELGCSNNLVPTKVHANPTVLRFRSCVRGNKAWSFSSPSFSHNDSQRMLLSRMINGDTRYCSSLKVSPSSFRYYSTSVEYLTGIGRPNFPHCSLVGELGPSLIASSSSCFWCISTPASTLVPMPLLTHDHIPPLN